MRDIIHILTFTLKIFTPEFDLSAHEQRMRVYLFKTEGEYRQYISGKIPQMSDYSGLYDIQTKTLILLDPQGSSGYQKAVVATAHKIIQYAYYILRDRTPYRESIDALA